MARLPGELEAGHLIDLAFVLHAFAGSNLAHDLGVLTDAPDDSVEGAAMPRGNSFVGHAYPEENASIGEVVQRGGLDAKRHGAAPIDVVDGRAKLYRPRARGHRRKQHQRICTVGLALPDGVEATVFGNLGQLDSTSRRIEGPRVELYVIAHSLSPSVVVGQLALSSAQPNNDNDHALEDVMPVVPGWQGRFFEDFRVGDVYRSRMGRTITQADNIWFTLLTNNTNQIHFNEHYAQLTEFGKPLVNSALTLAIVAGLGVADTSENGFALGWDEIKLPNPLFEGDTLYSESEVLERVSRGRGRSGASSSSGRAASSRIGTVVMEYTRSVMVWKREHAPAVGSFPEVKES